MSLYTMSDELLELTRKDLGMRLAAADNLVAELKEKLFRVVDEQDRRLDEHPFIDTLEERVE